MFNSGHINGVNVIGLSLQGPSVSMSVVRSPTAQHQQQQQQQQQQQPQMQQHQPHQQQPQGPQQPGDFLNLPQIATLQPRPPTTGSEVMLTLQPKLLSPLGIIFKLSCPFCLKLIVPVSFPVNRSTLSESILIEQPKVTLQGDNGFHEYEFETSGDD